MIQKSRLQILVLVMTVVAVAVYWLFVHRAWGDYRNFEADQERLNISLGELSLQMRGRKRTRARYEELTMQLGEPVKVAAIGDHMPRLMSEVEGICASTGIELRNVQPLGIRQGVSEPWIRFSLQVTATGELGEVTEMLRRFRVASLPIEIEKLVLRTPTRTDVLNIQMQLNWYVLLADVVTDEPPSTEGKGRQSTRR